MSEQLDPGIKVVRQASQIRTIEGVGTSVGGFLGLSEKGPIGVATLVTSWANFVDIFGSYVEYSYLAYAVFAFFNNGGSHCYVTRTGHYDDIDAGTLNSTDNKKAVGGWVGILAAAAINEGEWANYVASPPAGIYIVAGQHGPYDSTSHFTLDIYYEGDLVESFDHMNRDDTDSDYVETRINGISNYITVTDSDVRPPEIFPEADIGLHSGAYVTDNITDTDFIGSSASGTGLYAFDQIDEINLLSVPGELGTDFAIQKALIDYCEARSLKADGIFAICDPPANYNTQNIRTWRMAYLASEYAALYWPWLKITDPRTGRTLYVPPSGHMQGKNSEVSQNPGVYQAAAGVEYGRLRGVLDLQYPTGDQDRAVLNPVGVNVISFFEGSGTCIWGCRTMTPDNDFKYINVSRFFLYLEESIKEGTLWAVFRPNNERLWRQLRNAIETFLYNEWKTTEAIKGKTQEEAFFVVCDETNNPDSLGEIGKVIVNVGVAAVKTAEFIEIRIGQFQAGASVEILKREQARSYGA